MWIRFGGKALALLLAFGAAQEALGQPDQKSPRIDLVGRVTDQAGRPLDNAQVLLIFKSWPGGRYRQVPLQTKTDADGSFRFRELYDGRERTAMLVTIVKDGHVMESRYVISSAVKGEFNFALQPARRLKLQVMSPDGRPLASARVFPQQRKGTNGAEHFLYQQSAPAVAKRTDARGQVELNWFQTGDSVELFVDNAGTPSKVTFKVGDAVEQVVRVALAAPNRNLNKAWTPPPRPATPGQIAWVRDSAVSLKSIDPSDEDFADLKPLRKLIGDARIVQLGEQSHGDGACFSTKTRLIKFLHQEMGFDVLAFESGLFDCRKAWEAFQQGQPPLQAAQLGIFGIWTGSRQVQPLIEYLSAQANADVPLELCGFDCQFTAMGSQQFLVPELQQLITSLKITDANVPNLNLIYGGLNNFVKFGKTPPTDKRTFLKAVDDLVAILRDEDKLTAAQQRELSFWIQNLKSVRSHASTNWIRPAVPNVNARDAQMAENLVWLANDFYRGRKIIVWAASFHIMRNPAEIEVPDRSIDYRHIRPMGHLVAEKLGRDVFTIGFTAHGGVAGAYFRPKFALGTAPEGTFEAVCAAAGLENAIIPLHALDGGGEWLNEKQYARPLGYKWMKTRWPRHFDAICFNRKMLPSTR